MAVCFLFHPVFRILTILTLDHASLYFGCITHRVFQITAKRDNEVHSVLYPCKINQSAAEQAPSNSFFFIPTTLSKVSKSSYSYNSFLLLYHLTNPKHKRPLSPSPS